MLCQNRLFSSPWWAQTLFFFLGCRHRSYRPLLHKHVDKWFFVNFVAGDIYSVTKQLLEPAPWACFPFSLVIICLHASGPWAASPPMTGGSMKELIYNCNWGTGFLKAFFALMKFTGTGRLVCSQKVLVFFSNVLIWFVLATTNKVKLAQRVAMSWNPNAKFVIRVFTLRWGWRRKNVIKAIVAFLCGGAFALAKPCNYEWYPLWPALLSVPGCRNWICSTHPCKTRDNLWPELSLPAFAARSDAFSPLILARSLKKSLPCHKQAVLTQEKMTALPAERLSDPISVGLPGWAPAHCTCWERH